MFTKKEIYRSRWEYIYFFSFFLSLWMTSATHIDVREMIYFCLYYYYFLLPFFFFKYRWIFLFFFFISTFVWNCEREKEKKEKQTKANKNWLSCNESPSFEIGERIIGQVRKNTGALVFFLRGPCCLKKKNKSLFSIFFQLFFQFFFFDFEI